MSRQTMCAYGNCQEVVEDTPEAHRVTVVIEGERPKFCSLRHAAKWLLKHPRQFIEQVDAEERGID